jgi:hypothetical protein
MNYVSVRPRRDKIEFPVDGPSEFSWGPRPAPDKENTPPSRGGMYPGEVPAGGAHPEPGPQRAGARETRWTRGDPPRRYPGERVG